jgi:hypothetical protein
VLDGPIRSIDWYAPRFTVAENIWSEVGHSIFLSSARMQTADESNKPLAAFSSMHTKTSNEDIASGKSEEG